MKSRRFDFDNNGTFEGLETYTYNADGFIESTAYTYTSDGTPDTDLGSFSLLPAPATFAQTQSFQYDGQNQLDNWTSQAGTTRSIQTFTWNNARINTSTIESIDGTFSVLITYSTSYTGNLLTGWQSTSAASAGLAMSVVLTYDSMGVLLSDQKTQTATGSVNMRDFTWTAAGGIDLIFESRVGSSRTSSTDYIYVNGRVEKEVHTSSSQVYAWNYTYRPDGLVQSHRVDLDNDGSVETAIEIEWESATCRETVAWAPQALPSPFKRLTDTRAFAMGDGHFELLTCGSAP